VSLMFSIDTNIAIYAFSDDPKNGSAQALLEMGPFVSVQLLNEFANASLRKHRRPWVEIEEMLAIINSLAADIRAVDVDVHMLGREVAKRHKTGLYDSLIIAAALLDDSDTLYSEDMQHGLIIDDRLTIINPFLETA
jgi:predicted nucleic acid-binding protein